MAHYFFINQVSLKKDEDYSDSLIEWKYDIPLMFYPLFIGKTIYRNNLLYCPAKEGFEAVKNVYNFLEKHKDEVFANPDEFVSCKVAILEALEPKGTHYEMNGQDVFLMSVLEDDILDATKEYYAQMKNVNEQIVELIKDDDIKSLLLLSGSGGDFSLNFKQILDNVDVFKYGYNALCAYQFAPSQEELDNKVKIFKKGEKEGLKKDDGIIILKPCYDNIWEFDDEIGLAVVKNDDKFGHINKQGKVVIPLVYDDAFDFAFVSEKWDEKLKKTTAKIIAPVVLNEKYGLIDDKNQIIIPFDWDDIRIIQWNCTLFKHDLVFVKKHNKYGIFDVAGKPIYPLEIIDYIVGYCESEHTSKTGFYECFWVKTESESFYLNNKFEPYAHNLDIVQNGIQISEPNHDINYAFIAKDKNEKYGLISFHNQTLIPFEYEHLELIALNFYEVDVNLYFAKNKKQTRIYKIENEEKVSLIYEGKIDKVLPFYNEKEAWVEVIYKKKKGLFDVKKKEWVLPMDFDDFYICSTYPIANSNFLYAFKDDVIAQYNPSTIAKELLEIKYLENAIVQGFEMDKRIKQKIEQLKSNHYNSQINTIFTDAAKREMALTYFSTLNFDDPQQIVAATANIENSEEETTIIFLQHSLLFDAFEFHYHKNQKTVLLDLQYALFHYDKAVLYERNMENYEEAYIWGKKALQLLPEANENTIDIIEFFCRMAYLTDDFEESIATGNKGLAWIETDRNKVAAGQKWGVTNAKTYLNNLNDKEETIHYFLAKNYFYKPNPDYEQAKKHIEIALKMSNWNEYTKKYIYACCMVETRKPIDFLPVLDEFNTYASDFKPDTELAYIKYVYAYYEFHTNQNKTKALQLVEESLAIAPDYYSAKNLKKEINKSKGFFNFFK